MTEKSTSTTQQLLNAAAPVLSEHGAVSVPPQVDGCPDRVSVVIVNYRTPDDVETLVRDLARQERVVLDCVCVDITGDVDDAACGGVLDESGFTWRVLRSENVGYGRASNMGLKMARESWGARWAIVTNSDIEISDSLAVWRLQQALVDGREAGVWLVGPRIVAPDGRLQNPYRVSDMSPRQVRTEKMKHLWPVVSHLFENLQIVRYALKSLRVPVPRTIIADVCSHVDTQEVFAVHGCFFMIDIEAMYAGGVFPPFDGHIFMYSEEIALARRVLCAGGSEAYVPSVEVVHTEDASNRSSPRTRTLVKTFRQNHRSRRYVMRKYYGDATRDAGVEREMR